MSNPIMWVDATRCTGCGACVKVCPVGAIALMDGKARVDEELCTGCGACVGVCPEDAIQPVIHGELIPAPARPVPTAYQPGSLAGPAGAAIVATGVGLLAKAARALAQAVGRWLTGPAAVTRPPAAKAWPATEGGDVAGRERRRRHRRRGR